MPDLPDQPSSPPRPPRVKKGIPRGQVNFTLPDEVIEEMRAVCARGNCLPRDLILVALAVVGLKTAVPYAKMHPSQLRKPRKFKNK
jgi:hypothetical protein